jgi:riboflavin synthase
MFTGIITGVGRIVAVHAISSLETSAHSAEAYLTDDDLNFGKRLLISTPAGYLDDVGLGDSIAINGACMTAHDRLGGHIVSGHVDGIGQVAFFAPVGESWELRIRCPPALGKFMAYKGSITVNGVSLTVNRVNDSVQDGKLSTELSINLIPHTIENTALGSLKAGAESGSKVNLEIDTVARYVERMLSFEKLAAKPLDKTI